MRGPGEGGGQGLNEGEDADDRLSARLMTVASGSLASEATSPSGLTRFGMLAPAGSDLRRDRLERVVGPDERSGRSAQQTGDGFRMRRP